MSMRGQVHHCGLSRVVCVPSPIRESSARITRQWGDGRPRSDPEKPREAAVLLVRTALLPWGNGCGNDNQKVGSLVMAAHPG